MAQTVDDLLDSPSVQTVDDILGATKDENLLSNPPASAAEVPTEIAARYLAVKAREARREEDQKHPIREAFSALTTPAVSIPDVKPLNPNSVLDQSIASVVNKLKSSVVVPITSPLGAGAVISGGAVPLVGKTLGAAFGVNAITQEVPELVDAIKKGDVPRAAAATAGTAIGALMTTPAVKEVIGKSVPVENGFVRDTPPVAESPVANPLPEFIRPLDELRKGIVTRFKESPTVDTVAAGYDAIKTKSDVAANQAANDIGLEINRDPKVDAALVPMVESGMDKSTLEDQNNRVQASKAPQQIKDAYQYALDNFNDLQDAAQKAKSIFDDEHAAESSAGIDVDHIDNYVPHAYDRDAMFPGRGVILSETGAPSGRTSHLKQRVFPTYADAIDAGYVPEDFSITDSVRGRVAAGQRMINSRLWVDQLRSVTDTQGNPIVTDMVKQPKGTEVPPSGYVSMEPFRGTRVAVSEYFSPLLKALTGPSSIPKVLSNAEGFVKHSMLAFDTFHASRIMQKQMAMMGKVSYNKGVSLLEYSDKDLDAAIKSGEITQDMADYARENRARSNEALAQGLNVGGFSDALYRNVLDSIPKAIGGGIPRAVNRWVFDKLTRGAMLESYNWAWDRYRGDFPDLTDAEYSRNLAKQMNEYYGNLMSQGLFKSRTARDALRIVALAPNWVESMARNELRAVTEGARSVTGAGRAGPEGVIQPFKISANARATATGLMAYVVGTQLVNLFTRGNFTWENPEPDHKMDAYIPGGQSSPGFFVSPLSVFAELTHDFVRYMGTKEDAIAAATQIAKNKESPIARAVSDVTMGKDYFDRPLITPWEKAKQAFLDLTPIPISAGAAFGQEKYPGEKERRLFGAFGMKVEPARPEGKAPSFTQKRVGELIDYTIRNASYKLGEDRYNFIEQQLGQIKDDGERNKARRIIHEQLARRRK